MTDREEPRSRLTDTYVAALQHDLVELPPATTRVGVVRRPTPWFHGAVDVNVPALGPPADLLAETKELAESSEQDGVCAEEAHNAAWETVEFDRRYREHLATDPDAIEAVEDLQRRLDDGEPIALVCFENTDRKRCHRTILREVLEDG